MQVGIDIGGSLTKIVRLDERQTISFETLEHRNIEEIAGYLAKLQGARIYATGCGASELRERLGMKVALTQELESFCVGSQFFVRQSRNGLGPDDPYVLASFGTGTSVFYISQETRERITGTAVGGGTLTGLQELLMGSRDFGTLMELAEAGHRETVDLMVSDLYPEAKLSPVLSAMTASNFGSRSLAKAVPEDIAAAIIQLVTETISLLAIQVARRFEVEHVMIAGSPTKHPLIRQRFSQIGDLLGQKFAFLDQGPYFGAMGAIVLGSGQKETLG